MSILVEYEYYKQKSEKLEQQRAELLEALEKMVIEYQKLPRSLGYEYDLLPKAIEAISKAKGE